MASHTGTVSRKDAFVLQAPSSDFSDQKNEARGCLEDIQSDICGMHSVPAEGVVDACSTKWAY